MSKQAVKRSSSRTTVLSNAMKYVDEETRREVRDRRLLSLENDNYAEETEGATAEIGDEDDYNDNSDDDQKKKKPKNMSKKKARMMGNDKWNNKVVKPLERILLDNGIVRAGSVNQTSLRHREETVRSAYVDVEDDAKMQVEFGNFYGGSSNSSSNSPRGDNFRHTISNSSIYNNSSSSKEGQHVFGTSSSVTKTSASTYDADYWSAAATSSVTPTRRNFCSVCGYIGNYSCVRCGSRFCSIKCNTNHKETRCLKFSY